MKFETIIKSQSGTKPACDILVGVPQGHGESKSFCLVLKTKISPPTSQKDLVYQFEIPSDQIARPNLDSVRGIPFVFSQIKKASPAITFARFLGIGAFRIPFFVGPGKRRVLPNLIAVGMSGEKLDKVMRLALDEAFREASFDNWDGYGAKSANQESYDLTLKLLASLPSDLPRPEVAVDPDGEISLDWNAGREKVFAISVGKNGRLSYAGIFGENRIRGVEYFENEVPSSVMDNLRRLFSQEFHEAAPE